MPGLKKKGGLRGYGNRLPPKYGIRRIKGKKGGKKSHLDWGLKKADEQFSLFVRHRDGKCVMCGQSPPNIQLQCSHFWGRSRKNVRYDPENCDALCATCHFWGDSKRGMVAWEEEKQGEYRLFKIQQLGQERYDALERRAKSLLKDKIAIAQCQEYLAEMEYKGKPNYLKYLSYSGRL